MIHSTTPLLGVCAWGSGTGKTTLLTKLIPVLAERGIRVSVIKHAHHTFDIDHPGKDSYRLRESGAVQMLLGSANRWALVTELARTREGAHDPKLEELLSRLDISQVDMILVEGFRQEPFAKIEVYRPSLGTPLLATDDTSIIAIATDGTADIPLPQLDLNNTQAIADFVLVWLKNNQQN